MLIWRAKELLEGGSELLRAEVELASRRLGRMLADSLLLLGAVVLALVGVGVMLAAGAIEIAEAIGWSWALLIVGGALAGTGLIVWLAVAAARRDGVAHVPGERLAAERLSPKEEIAEAKDRLHNAATPGMDPEFAPPPAARDGRDAGTKVADFAMKNPVLTGSAAFLLLSLLGPGRTVRMVSRGIALIGLAGTVMDKLNEPKVAGNPVAGAGSPPPPVVVRPVKPAAPPALRPIDYPTRDPATSMGVG